MNSPSLERNTQQLWANINSVYISSHPVLCLQYVSLSQHTSAKDFRSSQVFRQCLSMRARVSELVK